MHKKISLYISAVTLMIFPFVAQAEVYCQQKNLACIIDIVIGYLNQILVLLIGLAVVMFVWYVIQYFIKADTDREKAAPYVMWSLIGFFVILSLWGLVNIIQNTFGLNNERNQPASWTSFKGLFPAGGSTSNGAGSNVTATSPFGSNVTATSPQGSNVTATSPTNSSTRNEGDPGNTYWMTQ